MTDSFSDALVNHYFKQFQWLPSKSNGNSLVCLLLPGMSIKVLIDLPEAIVKRQWVKSLRVWAAEMIAHRTPTIFIF